MGVIEKTMGGAKPTSAMKAGCIVAFVFAVAAACGATEEPATEAVGPTESETSTVVADPDGGSDSNDDEQPAAAEPALPSYSEHVLPVLESVCASCHGAGGPGSPHMVLETALDAQINAFGISTLVGTREMPPWPASPLSLAFVGDHSLSDDQVNAVVAWADAGGALDVDPSHPITPLHGVSVIEDPEMVLTSAAGAYQGSTDVIDDYRCLVFEPEVDETVWVLGRQFVPDQVEVVHHGIFSLASEELRPQAERLDAQDEAPGWPCYTLNGLNADGTGGYQRGFGGWAPGAAVSRAPEGFATPINPGDFLIIQVHYHFDSDAPADLSEFVLDLASDEEIAAAGGQYRQVEGSRYLGPAEIPCYDGDTNPLCDRDAAIERARELYGNVGAALPDLFLAECGARVSDFAEMTNGTASSSCDRPAETFGRIVRVNGHMHELGLSIRLTLNPDTPEAVILLDIPDWDFDWQLGYQPADEIIIERGDTIRIDCAWNRERAPYEAEGYIVWAEGTGDEMCFSSISTAPID